MFKLRGVLIALAALLCLLAVAACGGDDDDTDAGDDAPGDATTAAAATDGDGEETTAAGEETPEGSDPTEEPNGNGNGGGEVGDVCAILEKSEVEAAFGISMLDPELIPLPDVPVAGGGNASVASCSYVSNEAADSLSFTVYSSDGTGAQALVDLACANKDSVDIGDTACWYSEAQTEIQMKVGSSFIDIFVTTTGGDSASITEGLAEIAAGRLE